MSTFRTPVGPQPSKVYWRRRLVLALGLLAVIVIVVLIVVRPGAAQPGSIPTPGGTETPSASNTSAAEPAATDGECDLSKVTVEATTDAASYASGVNPVLSFTLKSLMTTPCTISAGSDVQEFRITSGSELIWTSKDCQTEPVAATTVLEPGVPKAGPPLTWDRTRSDPGTCEADRDQVIAGGASYHLEVKVGDLTSAETRQFLLN